MTTSNDYIYESNKMQYTHKDIIFRELELNNFNWKDYSWLLAKKYSKYFHKWWDAEKFNWEHSGGLAVFCSEYFETWWDPEKYDWRSVSYLFTNCQKYVDIWIKDYLTYCPDTNVVKFIEIVSPELFEQLKLEKILT